MATHGYDPSLEFPGVDSEPELVHDNVDMTTKRKPFRLVIVQSSVVPSKRCIADVSAHAEVSVGRDIPSEPGAPRLRLKEMAVSKYHAVIFWDAQMNRWGLVDVGSVHGTFIQGHGTLMSERLSAAKSASHPRYLSNLDVVKIGGTVMVCHLHQEEDVNCGDCILSAGNELSLVHELKLSHPQTNATRLPLPQEPQNAKKAIAKLKTRFLQQDYKRNDGHDTSENTYVDRAASRRMHLGPSDPPVVSSTLKSAPPPTLQTRTVYARLSQATSDPTRNPTQTTEAAQPIPISNIGHRLLSMQGWKPGTGLGVDQSGVTEQPIAKQMANRAGLGSETKDSTHR